MQIKCYICIIKLNNKKKNGTAFETFMFFYNKDRFVLNVANMEKRLNKK